MRRKYVVADSLPPEILVQRIDALCTQVAQLEAQLLRVDRILRDFFVSVELPQWADTEDFLAISKAVQYLYEKGLLDDQD